MPAKQRSKRGGGGGGVGGLYWGKSGWSSRQREIQLGGKVEWYSKCGGDDPKVGGGEERGGIGGGGVG